MDFNCVEKLISILKHVLGEASIVKLILTLAPETLQPLLTQPRPLCLLIDNAI